MMKKIFTFGLLLGLLAFSGTTFAQEQEYPHYGFWSNWSLGGSLDIVKQGDRNWKNNGGLSFGLSIMAEKELNYVWDYRVAMQFPGLLYTVSGDKKTPAHFDDFASLVMGVKFSVNDAIMGYNPDRKSSIYLLAMSGLSLKRNDATDKLGTSRPGVSLVGELGLGYSYRVCPKGTIFIEGVVDDHAGIRNIFNGKKHNLMLIDAFINVGYLYNFGPTAADLERLSQMNQMNNENYEALNNQIAELQNKIDNKDKQIKKLEARVSELEKELANVPKANTAAADSLQRLIDQIKADQMTYYALPFSILFDVDQYTVNATEMKKLAAVARVMKDNPDTKFNLYGFCDKSGSDKYNQKLSEKRVNEVKRLLVKKYGIAEDRLSTEGKGKSASFGDASYSINRRVSFYRVIE